MFVIAKFRYYPIVVNWYMIRNGLKVITSTSLNNTDSSIRIGHEIRKYEWIMNPSAG
jgi:hypothetical protein